MRASDRIIVWGAAALCLSGLNESLAQPMATGEAGAEFGLLDWNRPTSGPRDTGPSAAATEGADADTSDDEPLGSRFGVEVGVDYTSKYFFRGILQEDEDLIAQLYLDLSIELYSNDDFSLGAFAGVWTSLHSDTDTASDTSNLKSFYELDVYGGLSAAFGNLGIDAAYTAYTSPSDAFSTVEELSIAISWDDSEDPLLGHFALAPYALVAFELDGAADGGEEGVYLEIGVEPSFTLGEEGDALNAITFSVPISAGFSLDDYYEFDGDDEFFGFFNAGLAASYTLPVDRSWGEVTLHAGVHVLTLGDHTKAINDDDSTEVIFTAGVSVAH